MLCWRLRSTVKGVRAVGRSRLATPASAEYFDDRYYPGGTATTTASTTTGMTTMDFSHSDSAVRHTPARATTMRRLRNTTIRRRFITRNRATIGPGRPSISRSRCITKKRHLAGEPVCIGPRLHDCRSQPGSRRSPRLPSSTAGGSPFCRRCRIPGRRSKRQCFVQWNPI